ncbi:hypothetical protein A374_00804 [Fictibacillus macauensis ZFHKF-1]|uniref:DUF4227 family protein n=1 Tax=Fictibacillus macauensis ZFHKF-1 TaxID=1196324 RepID=I8UK65_9BACL|nr:YqzK family protein [Fictibacillus macauensis]EIT87275.1 hypothetical protein A374_00804 [Fictibacillus macauensis ZFHKF-1]
MKAWRAGWHAAKIFLSFTVCTLIFYFGLLWMNQEYQNYHKYDEPKGKAVKVYQANSSEVGEQGNDWLKRLLFFFESGE